MAEVSTAAGVAPVCPSRLGGCLPTTSSLAFFNGRNLGQPEAATTYYFDTWSGLGVIGSQNYFMANGSNVVGSFSIPAINYGAENCSYAPYIAAIWVGMDGFGNGDVLQAGVNAFGCGTPSYLPWFEWYTADCTT